MSGNGTQSVCTDTATSSPCEQAILSGEQQRHCLETFISHFAPIGPVELAVTKDLARHASAMDKWRYAGDALRRQTARLVATMTSSPEGSESDPDSVLAFAFSSDASDRAERYELTHTRGFYRALQQLQVLQERRFAITNAPKPPDLFRTESDCEAFLMRRFATGRYCCEECAHTRGSIIAMRKVWECSYCKRQTGLRSGTIMSNSQVPLLIWFRAIAFVLWRPDIGVRELADRIGISRIGTVRTISKRIREALAQEDSTNRLAGLDHFFSRSTHLTQVSPSALWRHSRGETPAGRPLGFPTEN